MVQSVGGYVGDRYEERPFNEKDSCSRQSEHGVLEDADVGPDILLNVCSHDTLLTSFGFVVGSQTCAYEEIRNAEEEEENER